MARAAQALVRLADKLKASTIVLAPHPHEFLDSLYHQSVRPPCGLPLREQGAQQRHVYQPAFHGC